MGVRVGEEEGRALALRLRVGVICNTDDGDAVRVNVVTSVCDLVGLLEGESLQS